MSEVNLIKSITQGFKRFPDQKNDLFTSDVEIIEVGNKLMGITIDEFSEMDDFFSTESLSELGRNLAIASLSDVLVSGCTPTFYLHSIVLPNDNQDFALEISKGISDVLDQFDTYLIGGDIGLDNKWRYTSTAIGLFQGNDPITRVLPKKKQSLWISGPLGHINLNAYTNKFINKLNYKKEDAKTIRKYALGSIDTSGGFMDSLWTLSMVNPGFKFSIFPEEIPYHQSVLNFCNQQKIPVEAFLLGGAGEYEFLFTTEEDIEIPNAFKIGQVDYTDETIIDWGHYIISNPPPSPRSFSSKEEYLIKIQEYLYTEFKK